MQPCAIIIAQPPCVIMVFAGQKTFGGPPNNHME
uniref:Uncharacterized protein n=1 Tax=Anguilla anguilla TaxID=7936 RepID=A0A0E9Q3B4_ANGAN